MTLSRVQRCCSNTAHGTILLESLGCLIIINPFLVQTKMSWRSLHNAWYSTPPLRIKVQSCPVLP